MAYGFYAVYKNVECYSVVLVVIKSKIERFRLHGGVQFEKNNFSILANWQQSIGSIQNMALCKWDTCGTNNEWTNSNGFVCRARATSVSSILT